MIRKLFGKEPEKKENSNVKPYGAFKNLYVDGHWFEPKTILGADGMYYTVLVAKPYDD